MLEGSDVLQILLMLKPSLRKSLIYNDSFPFDTALVGHAIASCLYT